MPIPPNSPEERAADGDFTVQPAGNEYERLFARVEARQKQLWKAWLESAEKVQNIYDAKDTQKYPFNILYSNTETILPALFNSTPRPEVARRYTALSAGDKRTDSAVSQAVQRALEYLADTNDSEYESYGEAVREAVVGMLVPGLGQARVHFKQVEGYQTICFDSVAYDRFVWAYARKWQHVPWVAFGHDLDKAGFEANYPEFAKTPEYLRFEWKALEEADTRDDESEADVEPMQKGADGPVLLVWEVWDHAKQSITHICGAFKGRALFEEPYPRGLPGRFPCPAPLMFKRGKKQLLPIPSYRFYEAQAEELNDIARRMRRLVRAVKARGVYNAAMEEIETLLNEDSETILVPSTGAAAFAEGGLDRQFWFMPIDMLVSALLELRQAFDQCRQAIYEIMGIGDILRGASDPNETAKAQQIKNTWGSLRIKKRQVDVQQFCLELFRIAAGLAGANFTPATWQQMTRLPYLFRAQKTQLQQVVQQEAMAAQEAQAAGQQPPPSQIPPEQQALLQAPAWEDIIAVLQNNFERGYRIDIETNSTVDLEATEDKEAIAEFMNAFGQMMAGLQPLVQEGILPFEAAKVFMSEVTRRFRFGRRVEDVLETMQQPAQPDNGEAAKQQAQLEVKKAQADASSQVEQMRKQITEMAGELQRKEIELTALRQQGQLDNQSSDLDKKQLSLDFKERSMSQKSDYDGKMRMAKEQVSQKDQQLSAKELQGMAEAVRGQISEFETRQKAAQQVATERAEAPARTDAALTQMTEALREMMEAIQAVGRLAGAERESEITVGPDGKKRARSRPVLQ